MMTNEERDNLLRKQDTLLREQLKALNEQNELLRKLLHSSQLNEEKLHQIYFSSRSRR